jgi:hypothetical protein
MERVRLISLGCGLALTLLAGPSVALGSTTIGSDLLNAAPNNANCTGEVDYLQTAIPGRTLLAPTPGVITQWGVRDSGGPLALRVVHQVSGETYTFIRSSSVQSGSGAGSGVQTFATRLVVAAGDGIAIDCTASSGIGFRSGLGGTYTYDSFFPAPADGTSPLGSAASGTEFMFNASIEPDADNDGFGDETQDQCPTDPTTQGACPTPTSPAGTSSSPAVTGLRAAGLKKCKKKHGAARAKCKKRANLLPV